MFVLRASARKPLDFPLSRSHNSHSSDLSLGRGSSLVSMGKTHWLLVALLGLRPSRGLGAVRVSNGDGSFQIAAGEVILKLRLGPGFAQRFTFV